MDGIEKDEKAQTEAAADFIAQSSFGEIHGVCHSEDN